MGSSSDHGHLPLTFFFSRSLDCSGTRLEIEEDAPARSNEEHISHGCFSSFCEEDRREREGESRPARRDKAVEENAELQGHVLIVDPADYGPKLPRIPDGDE